MTEGLDELNEQARAIVRLIRSQNWKLGGVHSIDANDAEAAVLQLVRTAFAAGCVVGTRETGDRMLATFDEVAGKIRPPVEGECNGKA